MDGTARAMVQPAETLRPPVGTPVYCYFLGNRYAGKVVGYGRAAPRVRFQLKNGRVIEGPATVLPPGDWMGNGIYRGYLARLRGRADLGPQFTGGI